MEFLQKTGDFEKSKTPRKSQEKWTFLSLAFYNAPILHIVEKKSVRAKQPIKLTK